MLSRNRTRVYFRNIRCIGKMEYTLDFVKIKTHSKVPDVISGKEVRKIIKYVRIPDYKMCLELIYACGLRIGEVVKIRTSYIDGERKILTIRNGKGANIKAISKFLGHKSLRPTMIYLHLTNNAEEHSYKILNEIMSDL